MKNPTTICTMFIFMLFTLVSFSQDSLKFVKCPNMKTYPYYAFGVLNEQSFPSIKKYFREEYDADKMKLLEKNSGIVTVRFAINCEGESGEFEAFSCDFDYVPNEISPEILNYFLTKTKQLGGWKIPIHEETGTSNAHKFYSFRILNGELTEILPR